MCGAPHPGNQDLFRARGGGAQALHAACGSVCDRGGARWDEHRWDGLFGAGVATDNRDGCATELADAPPARNEGLGQGWRELVYGPPQTDRNANGLGRKGSSSGRVHLLAQDNLACDVRRDVPDREQEIT